MKNSKEMARQAYEIAMTNKNVVKALNDIEETIQKTTAEGRFHTSICRRSESNAKILDYVKAFYVLEYLGYKVTKIKQYSNAYGLKFTSCEIKWTK